LSLQRKNNVTTDVKFGIMSKTDRGI